MELMSSASQAAAPLLAPSAHTLSTSAPWQPAQQNGAGGASPSPVHIGNAPATPGSPAPGPIRKAGLSCAECRRSKLKCDRVFPCQSCIRRGCAAICPSGALAATKGNKLLVARAEKLSQQVTSMSARIHELEAALAEAQTHIGKQVHPLLAASVKWEEPDDIGLPPESDGESAGGSQAYDEHEDEADGQQLPPEMSWMSMHHLGLPSEIITLATAFPLGMTECPSSQALFYPFIPRRQRTDELMAIHYKYCAWMYDPISRTEFAQLLDMIYGNDLARVHAHGFATFFMVMCIGSLFDTEHADHEILTERYHALARAALSFHSIVHHRTCTTMQAIMLMVVYKYITPRPSPEYRWLMSGVLTRVAQAMGLQRDSSGWGLSAEEENRRRVIFWEVFVFETWTSFWSGRPSMLNLRQITARFPEDREPVVHNGEVEIGFHSWLYRFVAGCMSLAIQHVFAARKPPYEQLLELDAKIRRFPVPRHLRTPLQYPPTPWADEPAAAMRQFCQSGSVEHTVLYLHRSYFAQARGEPTQEMYGRSFWAVFRSSARLIRSLESLARRHPEMTSKVWYFWSTYYASCIALGCMVLDKPWCQLSPHALTLLVSAAVVYEQGSPACVPSTLRVLHNMVERAQTAYMNYQHNGPPRKCGSDCCDKVSADDVRRFVDGADEAIPGEKDMPSPGTRPASSSPPGYAAEPHTAPSAPEPSTPTLASATGPSLPPLANTYLTYGQFVPPNIDNAQPALPTPAPFVPQLDEPWFYTPAAVHGAYELEHPSSSSEAFSGLAPYYLRAGMAPVHTAALGSLAPYQASFPGAFGPPPPGSQPYMPSPATPNHPLRPSWA